MMGKGMLSFERSVGGISGVSVDGAVDVDGGGAWGWGWDSS